MDGDDAALAIICGWNWGGSSGAVTRSIADTVNELALNGHRRASNLVLSLLSDGKLSATGFYKWQGFLGEHNQNEGYGEIPARRWQALQAGLAMPRDRGGALPNVYLSAISFVYNDLRELPVAEWDWRESLFSTATNTGEMFDEDHFEEWFSAWEIEIAPPTGDADAVTSVALLTPAIEANGGGRPTALDWEIAALEMAGRYYRGELKPKSTADIIRAIQEWVGGANGEPPDGTVRPHAKRIFEAFKAWESD